MTSKNGIFIVFEGTDGAGKSTQVKLLRVFLKNNNIRHQYIHFPQYKKKPYGDLISRYLRGEFGKADEVNPYLASLLYAGDRKASSVILRGWIDDGFTVIADRYIMSNIAYQRAKIKNESAKEEFVSWLEDYEYKYNKILKPHLTIFLDAPDDFIVAGLSKDRGSRAYLQNYSDIHENDMDYQLRVIMEYRMLCKSMKSVLCIKCYDKKGIMLPPKEIHRIILRKLQDKFPNVFKDSLYNS